MLIGYLDPLMSAPWTSKEFIRRYSSLNKRRIEFQRFHPWRRCTARDKTREEAEVKQQKAKTKFLFSVIREHLTNDSSILECRKNRKVAVSILKRYNGEICVCERECACDKQNMKKRFGEGESVCD